MSLQEVCKVILLRNQQVFLTGGDRKKRLPSIPMSDVSQWIQTVYTELIQRYGGNQDSYRLLTKLEPHTDKVGTGVCSYVLVLLVADDDLPFANLSAMPINQVMDGEGLSRALRMPDCGAWEAVLPLVKELDWEGIPKKEESSPLDEPLIDYEALMREV